MIASYGFQLGGVKLVANILIPYVTNSYSAVTSMH